MTCGSCGSVADALWADHPVCLHRHIDASRLKPFELMLHAMQAPKCFNYLYCGHIDMGLQRFNYELRKRREAAT